MGLGILRKIGKVGKNIFKGVKKVGSSLLSGAKKFFKRIRTEQRTPL